MVLLAFSFSDRAKCADHRRQSAHATIDWRYSTVRFLRWIIAIGLVYRGVIFIVDQHSDN